MNLLLVSSQMPKEELSEQLSVHEGAGYNEVFGSVHEPEGSSWSSERETSTQPPDEEVESYGEEDEMEGEKERGSDRDEGDGDEETFEETSGSSGDNHPFILLSIWTVNDFLPKMSDKVFNHLRDCYQIPNNIPIHLPGKSKKC